ncbi:MAG TPA: M23 family metallopeptidase [Nanoarchaeota archaeon]|nr:M23 family metallopeptidase [Nanoarchaeota archaeon]
MDEYPVASVVFIILVIAGLGLGLALAIELMFGAQEEPAKQDYAFYQQKQEVANAFHNLAKAYQDCVLETNCMCGIYKLKFPEKYSIRMQNEGRNVKLTLLEGGKELLSETINNINTGVLESKTDKTCGLDGIASVHADGKRWYLQEGENIEMQYLPDSIEEIYKPSEGKACIITESMIINTNETKESMEDYFGNLPRCTFKKKKKEELALSSFSAFVEEFNDCGGIGAKEEACMCDFSRISLPEEYEIRAELDGGITRFTLLRLKQGFEPEKTMLEMDGSSAVFAEQKDNPEFYPAGGCIKSKNGSTKYYENCGERAAQLKAVFFSNRTKAGFLANAKGIIRLDGTRVNRANIEPCMITRKNIYEYAWPVEKLNNVFYAGSCFGPGENNCGKGISMPQKNGAPVFAADDGLVEYVGANTIRLKHTMGIRTFYENVMPLPGLNVKDIVSKGQKIGAVSSAANPPALLFSISDKLANANLLEDSQICRERENKAGAISVFRYGVYYVNPACYFSEPVRNSIVYPNKCETMFRGCDIYGNEETPKYDIRLKVLVIPVNWERQLSYLLYANNALEKFLRAIPLEDCPQRFSKMFVDGRTDFGENWYGGSCIVEHSGNCLSNALETIKKCAEQYRERTGESYDFVVGVDDSNIANYPECNFADRGWTNEKSDAAIVEAQNAADMLHELGHKFGLRDQYCDCSSTASKAMCGFSSWPNPLKKELGCGSSCCIDAVESYPYMEGCRWCSGNLDINAKDTNNDKMLDSGRKTAMSNFIDSDRYSIDEYLMIKSSPMMQCT